MASGMYEITQCMLIRAKCRKDGSLSRVARLFRRFLSDLWIRNNGQAIAGLSFAVHVVTLLANDAILGHEHRTPPSSVLHHEVHHSPSLLRDYYCYQLFHAAESLYYLNRKKLNL